MNNQKSSKKGIWIVIGIVAVAGAAAYFYFQGLAPSSGTLLQTAESPDVSAQIIGLLAQIQAIKIDPSLFNDPAYQTLRDYTVAIPSQPVGRPNPFAPLPGVANPGIGAAGAIH